MKYVARVDKVLRPGIHKTAEVRGGKLTPGSELPVPDRVEIELLRPDSSCTMYRYTDRGEFCGDTWHETLADAFTQAAFEYGLSPQDFVSLPEG